MKLKTGWERRLNWFITGYLKAIAFTTIENLPSGEFMPEATREEIEMLFQQEDLPQIVAEGAVFFALADHLIQACMGNDADYEKAGTDFHFTRNGDGCGFWDGDWPMELGDKLTELVDGSFGQVWYDIGEDGLIFIN